MTKEILGKIKEKILNDKDEILETVEGKEKYVISAVKSNNSIGDIIDEANNLYETEVYNILNKKGLEKLQKIDKAINRIEEGEYGICIVCIREIDQKRLFAIPETNKCVVCKSAEERRKI